MHDMEHNIDMENLKELIQVLARTLGSDDLFKDKAPEAPGDEVVVEIEGGEPEAPADIPSVETGEAPSGSVAIPPKGGSTDLDSITDEAELKAALMKRLRR